MAESRGRSIGDHKGSLSYPDNLSSEELGYVRYDIYPYRREKSSHIQIANINLHMPAEISDALASEWTAESDILRTGVQTAKSLANTIKTISGDSASIEEKVGTLVGAGLEGLDQLGTTAENVLGIPGLSGLTSGMMRRKRKVANPHEVHAFKGVGFRTFEFTHKLIPFNAQDSLNIRRMLHWFRLFAAPGESSETHLTYPAEWNIGFYTKGTLNPFLPQINKCVLTSVGINYAGSSTWSMHHDGAPTDVELTLQFQETVLPTRDVIKAERKAWDTKMTASQRNAIIDDLAQRNEPSMTELITAIQDLEGEATLRTGVDTGMAAKMHTFFESWEAYIDKREQKEEF